MMSQSSPNAFLDPDGGIKILICIRTKEFSTTRFTYNLASASLYRFQQNVSATLVANRFMQNIEVVASQSMKIGKGGMDHIHEMIIQKKSKIQITNALHGRTIAIEMITQKKTKIKVTNALHGHTIAICT